MTLKSITLTLESEAIDGLRDADESDAQVITRVIYASARPGMIGRYRAAEKGKVDFAALKAAELSARNDRAVANLVAESTADAAVAAKLGG